VLTTLADPLPKNSLGTCRTLISVPPRGLAICARWGRDIVDSNLDRAVLLLKDFQRLIDEVAAYLIEQRLSRARVLMLQLSRDSVQDIWVAPEIFEQRQQPMPSC
jgi:hypothetical protein